MSRYVDLDGNTWDGKPLKSKIQGVKTKHGYMTAITTGWLFREGVPYLDIEKHDAEVRADAIKGYKSKLRKQFIEYYDEHGYPYLSDIIEILDDCEMKLKEQSHE